MYNTYTTIVTHTKLHNTITYWLQNIIIIIISMYLYVCIYVIFVKCNFFLLLLISEKLLAEKKRRGKRRFAYDKDHTLQRTIVQTNNKSQRFLLVLTYFEPRKQSFSSIFHLFIFQIYFRRFFDKRPLNKFYILTIRPIRFLLAIVNEKQKKNFILVQLYEFQEKRSFARIVYALNFSSNLNSSAK